MESEAARGPTGSDPGDEPWTVFDAVPDKWPDSAVDSLARWKQGHLITGVPLTWLMPEGHDDITGIDNPSGTIAPASRSDLCVEAGIICSQTCDIGADSTPGNYNPFILVAPLIRESQLPSGSLRNLARECKVGFLFPVLPLPALGEPGQGAWYADLRIMVPMSKAVLVGRDPVDGLETEADSLSFGETIAQRFRRPALSEQLSDIIPRILHRFVKDNGRNKPAFLKVEQVRLTVTERSRLNPRSVRLIVLTDSDLTEDEQALWREFGDKLQGALRREEIHLMPLVFESPRVLTADVYRSSVPIFCDLLRFPQYP